MKSIFQERKECYRCRTTENLHEHHIFGGGRRGLSEQYGLKVYLCARHHNLSDESVHFDLIFDKKLKQVGQRAFESRYGREKFIAVFGKNYMGD